MINGSFLEMDNNNSLLFSNIESPPTFPTQAINRGALYFANVFVSDPKSQEIKPELLPCD
ncbi:MAG: hypothetical protein L3J06_03515 [Cyclobacteriaceae bacterium]|nr:hypothetical protein [Cyclobacteriaceae bacterium]